MFTVTVENMDSNMKLISESFETKKEANKFKRETMKSKDLANYSGHIVNFISRLELVTNY